jgi:hypothetical protein
MNVLRSLKHRSFALLWTGQTASRLSNRLHRIVLAWWALEKTGSATAMGTVLVLSQIPLLIFLLVGAPTVFLIGGSGTILMILLGLCHPAIRNLD